MTPSARRPAVVIILIVREGRLLDRRFDVTEHRLGITDDEVETAEAFGQCPVDRCLETAAAARGTAARPLPLLLSGIQPTVRALLSAVTVASSALPAGASPPLPPPPVLAAVDGHDLASHPVDAEPAAAPAEAVAPAGPVYVVERGDTWWSIAETVLGSGTRWAEVVADNDGHTMPGGTAVTADTVRPLVVGLLGDVLKLVHAHAGAGPRPPLAEEALQAVEQSRAYILHLSPA